MNRELKIGDKVEIIEINNSKPVKQLTGVITGKCLYTYDWYVDIDQKFKESSSLPFFNSELKLL